MLRCMVQLLYQKPKTNIGISFISIITCSFWLLRFLVRYVEEHTFLQGTPGHNNSIIVDTILFCFVSNRIVS